MRNKLKRLWIQIVWRWCRLFHGKHHARYWTEYAKEFHQCGKCGCYHSKARAARESAIRNPKSAMR